VTILAQTPNNTSEPIDYRSPAMRSRGTIVLAIFILFFLAGPYGINYISGAARKGHPLYWWFAFSYLSSFVFLSIIITLLSPLITGISTLRKGVWNRLCNECPEVMSLDASRMLFVAINDISALVMKKNAHAQDRDVGFLFLQDKKMIYRGNRFCFDMPYKDILSIVYRWQPWHRWIPGFKWIEVKARPEQKHEVIYLYSRKKTNDLYAYLKRNVEEAKAI